MSLGKYTSLGSAWTTFYYRQNVDLTMNDADNLIEIKLICGLKKGSLKAFDAIYDMYAKRLYAYCLQYTKSEEDAEDIAQDIFVKLWEKPDLWLEREKLDSYLYTVVRNHIYNFLKHKAVEYDYLDVAAEKMQMAERGLPTPDDEFCAHELELFVQMALERMPEQRRRIFLMSREEGMTSPEIAAKLNISVRTVEQHIYKALQDLKKIVLFLFFFYLD